ncbi:MAG: DUF357 domain-containing protein [Candidatus Micrarchaeaceae archaeon]|jgi:uncharacterized protein
MQSSDDEIIKRIEKDIALFNDNIKGISSKDKAMARVIELSKMYAKDSKSYLDKKDFYTSFSCISYAHGLLDALKDIMK